MRSPASAFHPESFRAVPDWRELLIAEREGRPVGFVQIIDPLEEETHCSSEVAPDLRAIDIWIGEEQDLGRAAVPG